MRDPRYDPLFEPIKLGPVTAKNRFYQVPHCTGLGHVFPKAEAAMRGMKAAGGWAVVSTQEVDIHHSADSSPFIEGRLWDQGDMRRLALSAAAIHEHGALAAIELTHNGHAAGNAQSRRPRLAVSELALSGWDPAQCQAMTRKDIAALRRWHRRAAIRAWRRRRAAARASATGRCRSCARPPTGSAASRAPGRAACPARAACR